jgi:hypothetical protein
LDLEAIIRSVIEPHQCEGARRFELKGSGIAIKPNAINGLALVINELSTNALATQGRDFLGAEDDRLSVRWEERGGAAVEAEPERSGFGSRLLDATIARQFGGSYSRDWQRGGNAVVFKLLLLAVFRLSSRLSFDRLTLHRRSPIWLGLTHVRCAAGESTPVLQEWSRCPANHP